MTTVFKKIQLICGLLAVLATACQQPAPHPSAPVPAPEYPRDAPALALRVKADSMYQQGNTDSSYALARAAAARAEQMQDWHTWGEAQTYILAARYEFGQHDSAIASFPQLEQKARSFIPRDSAFWTDYFNIAGAMYNAVGNYESALRYGLQEIDFYEKTGNQTSLALANTNVGAYYMNRGDYDRALDYTLAALQSYSALPKANPMDIIWVQENLSLIWYRKTAFDQAIIEAEKGIHLLQQVCSGAIESNTSKTECLDRKPSLSISLANAYLETGSYEKAISSFNNALHLLGDKQDAENLAYTLDGLGNAYCKIGHFDQAQSCLEKALKLYGPKHPNYSNACRHMGMLKQMQGDLQAALEWKQKALVAAGSGMSGEGLFANPRLNNVNAYYDIMHALTEKGAILQDLAEKEDNIELLDASLAAFHCATQVLDSMRNIYQEGSKQFWNKEARPILEQAIETAMRLQEKTGKPGYLEQAFTYAEKGKAYLLAEALRESAARQQAGIPSQDVEEEKRLRINIAFYQKQIFEEQLKPRPDSARVLLWQAEIQQFRRRNDQLMSRLARDYPEYYQIKYRQKTPTLADIQSALTANTGLLEYFKGDRNTYAFYIDKNAVRAGRCHSDSTLSRLLEGVRNQEQVAAQGRSAVAVQDFVQAARAVYQGLLEPVVPIIPENLIIIPDGSLAYLPFELLLTQDPQATAKPGFTALPYLLRASSIRYEYSALLTLQSEVKRRPSRFFAGYAPSYPSNPLALNAVRGETGCRNFFASDFGPLPNNQKEVEQIASIVQGKVFTGEQASESHFHQHAQEARILHLAMHGFLNDCEPALSGLVFSPEPNGGSGEELDTILHTYEIYNLHLNADLTVLSACNSGRGQLAQGEGVISLARAFKYAGCPNVLMSLWQADDEATAKMMTGFYSRLAQGKGKAEAIRQAKLDYIDNNPRNHPFYWAGFVLIGDDQPISTHSTRPYFIVGILLLAGLFFWMKKGRSLFTLKK